MGRIKVVVVDDSKLARELIRVVLSSDEDIEVIGEALNGKDATEKVALLKPDIVTMDIEMPVMDGLKAIEEIMALHAVPILVVTTRADAHMAYAAIKKGALDLVEKPDVNLEGAAEFISKIKLLSKIRVITHIRSKYLVEAITEDLPAFIPANGNSEKLVAVASSSGGPEALSILLSGLPAKFPCPVVVAQHMTDGYMTGMVEWFRQTTLLNVKVGSDGDVLEAGTVYVSPSEKHMRIKEGGSITLVERRPADIYRPSCDILLKSAAALYGPKGIGIILTGMGSDGVLGIKSIKEAGGTTIAQDEKTSAVFGMPRAAIEGGYVDSVLPIEDISSGVIGLLGGYSNKGKKDR
jgi:two-component system chemotaxis response regulator CheB